MKPLARRIELAHLPEYQEIGLPSQEESELRLNQARRDGGGFMSLGVADSRIMRVPKHVVEETKKVLDSPNDVYTLHEGELEVRQTISEFLKREKSLDADPLSEIIVTPGTQMGIFSTIASILDSGDETVLTDPDYSCVEPVARLFDARVVSAPMSKHEGQFSFNGKAFQERVTNKTKLFIFSNPNNPTGYLYTKEDLKLIVDLAHDYDFYVLADELYGRLVYDGLLQYSFASLPGAGERTITLMGVSKTESMQGFRAGFLFADKQVTRAIRDMVRYAMQRAPYYAQRALMTILTEPKELSEERVKIHQEKRDLIARELKKARGILCNKPAGTSYVFPDVTALGLSSQEFCEQLVKTQRISVTPGFGFGRQGEGHFRLCFACGNDRLVAAAKGMAAFAESIAE
jgi:aspartate/methionine/tyrosine aminotransferase